MDSPPQRPAHRALTVVGGGVIGLTCALTAADAGWRVRVLDAGTEERASWVAGGMLGSLGEGHPGEDASLPFMTQITVTISDVVTGYWWALLMLLGAGIYTFLVSVIAGLACGLAPVLRSSGARLHEALRSGGRETGGGLLGKRARSALVLGEIALSTALAAGALLIHTDESATYPWQVVQSSWSGTQYALPPEPGAPALGVKAWLTESAARDLAKRGGRDLDALRKAASARGFKATPLGIRAAATLQQRASRRTAPNVVARLAGTNDREAVVFTSHWDHFGMRDRQPGDPPDADRIYNGAYDNASGCAGLIEIARAMARAGARPGRSMYFVFTTAEESGLLGAEYFISHPPIPPAQMAANINVDGINYLGPTSDMVLLGSDRSTLGPLVETILKERGRTLGADAHPERGYFFRSDHFPLAKAGVPALSISEPKQFLGPNADALLKKQEEYNGKDYHQPTDQYDPSWNFAGAVEDLRVLAQLAWRVAASPAMPSYNEGDQFANARK